VTFALFTDIETVESWTLTVGLLIVSTSPLSDCQMLFTSLNGLVFLDLFL